MGATVATCVSLTSSEEVGGPSFGGAGWSSMFHDGGDPRWCEIWTVDTHQAALLSARSLGFSRL